MTKSKNVSGGINIDAEDVQIGGDAVGRDKVTQNVRNVQQVVEAPSHRGCYADISRIGKFAFLFLLPGIIIYSLLSYSVANFQSSQPTAVAIFSTATETATAHRTPTLISAGTPTPEPRTTPTPGPIAPTTTPSPIPSRPTPSLIAPYPCSNSLPSRLAVQMEAYVGYEPPDPLRIRTAPGVGNDILGKMPPGEIVTILDGPVCADDFIWWKVSWTKGGIVGWSAEGDHKDYWLIPK
jgi:hypothetical protein